MADNPSAHTVDKSGWADGPWMTEPDYVSWTDEATGLDCLVVRNRMGALCGYVGMPVGHPWFGLHYDEVPQAMDSAAHGGLTYSSECAGHICHDSPNEVWWLGFDCGHYGDLSPHETDDMLRTLLGRTDRWFASGVYRDLAYVRSRCAMMAAVAAEVLRG